MRTKVEVNGLLIQTLPFDLARDWWNIKLPALGHRTPNEAWEAGDEEAVYEHAEGYLERWNRNGTDTIGENDE